MPASKVFPARGARTAEPRRPAARWGRLLSVLALCAAAQLVPGLAEAAPQVHVVGSGQRLGSIAKRYNISIDELCRANGITRKTRIHPGQKLVIPGTEAPAPSAPPVSDAPATSAKAAIPARQEPARELPTQASPAPRAGGYGKPSVHVVGRGQTLGAIARRYKVSVEAMCRASGISRLSRLHLGQTLVIPSPGDTTGERALAWRLNGPLDRGATPSGGKRGPHSYARTPARRGYLTLVRNDRAWGGQVVGQHTGKLLPKARARVSSLLGAGEDGTQMDAQLLQLLVRVSDHFGGRPIRVVSGLRENSYFHDSKHPLGRAMDFSIPGVPNEIVRDYCKALGSVGVGYYPNSSFVHLDVRERFTYWVDYAGPGEPPRATPWAARPKSPTSESPAEQPEPSPVVAGAAVEPPSPAAVTPVAAPSAPSAPERAPEAPAKTVPAPLAPTSPMNVTGDAPSAAQPE